MAVQQHRRRGLKVRLFLVFGVLSALTVLASAVAWRSYNQLGDELNRVVEQNISALRTMADLKEQSAKITVVAPTLLAAPDEARRAQIERQLEDSVATMLAQLPQLSAHTQGDPAQSLRRHSARLQQSIEALDENVRERLKIQAKKLRANGQLRWAGSVFLGDIDALLQRVQQSLYSDYNRRRPNWSSIDNGLILAVSEQLQALYRIKADVNLLTNLVDRAQYLPDLNSLVALDIYSEEVVARLDSDLQLVGDVQGVEEIAQTVREIVVLTRGDANIFALRRVERRIIEGGDRLLEKLRQDLALFNQATGERAQQAEREAQASAHSAQQTIEKGRLWMVFTVGLSLLFSVLAVWLYVGRNIVGRITALDRSMRTIASGHLEHSVPVSGRDEIGTMARSLESFRDQLLTLQEELVQAGKLAAQGQLSAGIAHEINQPLSAVGHYARNGAKLIEVGRTEEAAENLRQISSLTKRATTIITRLKSLGRQQQANLVAVDVQRTVDNVLLLLEAERLDRSVAIEVSVELGLLAVSAEPIQLEQVLLNLLTNALDAVAEREHKAISIDCVQRGERVDICVSDSGPGISAERAAQIFDPFFTTKRRGENLGLGLSISFNIIKNFGGKLSVDTTREHGAAFTVSLQASEQNGSNRK
ncbi:MAG: ATP-binding protein [Pseudomonadales bacterium]